MRYWFLRKETEVSLSEGMQFGNWVQDQHETTFMHTAELEMQMKKPLISEGL